MATIYYARLDEFWRKEEKYAFLDEQRHVGAVAWQPITPDKRHTWLTEGMQDEFETFLPLGTEETKARQQQNAIFALFSNGVKSNRDAWVYNYNQEQLATNIQRLIKTYNDELSRWQRTGSTLTIDDFVTSNSEQISWSEGLKTFLQRQVVLSYNSVNLRKAFYRPFVQTRLYFDRHLNERRYQMPFIFPTQQTEHENYVLWVKTGSEWPTFGLMVNCIPDLLPQGGSQCFPFYTYDEDGSNRRENITDWALDQFRRHYAADAQSKIPNQKSRNGIFPITSTPSFTTPTTAPNTPPTCVANCRASPLLKISGALPRPVPNWRRCMSAMNSSLNIVWTLWKPQTSRSTGASNA